jgi:two-component system, chemotaxis family, chemotaxis protein CheY
MPARPIILTIDDAKAVRLLVEKVLSPFDCEVNEASNGFNGLFAMEKARPDLMLVDVSMPVMNGIDMLERVKSAPEVSDIPIIMMTSRSDHAYMAEIMTLGAQDTLMKPFSEADLLQKIRSVIKLVPKKSKPA